MRILHIANTNTFSGAENVICQIMSMFVDDKDVEMAYVSPDGQIREALAERDIRFVPIRRMCVSELRTVFKKENPDVIHAHDMRASYYAALACGKTRLVLHLHNNEFDNRRISKKSVGFLIPSQKASHIFYVSKSAYEGYFFHHWFRKKSSVLYNVIDISQLHAKLKNDRSSYNYDMLYLGRLTYQKDPVRLLKVIQIVKELYPEVKVAIVGTGEMEEEVKKSWRELGLQGNVDLLGFQSNPLKILEDAKLMLMTSRWEGTPMCALESMALGTPIVSTPTDGLKDLIEDGKTGFLADDNHLLAEKIVSILRDKDLRASLSEACKAKSAIINDLKSYKRALAEAYFEEQ